MQLVVVPQWLSLAAADIAGVGSAVSAANATAFAPTTSLLAAAEDEVSAAIAALFSAHGRGYQAVSSQAHLFQQKRSGDRRWQRRRKWRTWVCKRV